MGNILEMVEEFAGQKTDPAKTDEIKTEVKVETPAPAEFDYIAHYKGLGIEATTREEAEGRIKEILTKYDELKDYPTKYQTTQQELDQLKAKQELLSKQIDPLSYFSSPDAYIREQLAKKHPEYDSTILPKVLGDTSKLTDIEVLALGRRLSDSDIFSSDAKAIADIEATYGIDLDTNTGTKFEDLPVGVQTRIQKEAKNLRQSFNSLRSEVELPKAVDPNELLTAKQGELQQLTEQIKTEWKPFVDTLPTQLDKVAIKDGEEVLFEYAIDDSFKQELASKAQVTLDFLAKQGQKVSDEAKAAIIEDLKNTYVVKNLSKIMKSYSNNKLAEMDEKTFRELHNAKGANTQSTNGKTALEGSKEAAEQKILESMQTKYITKL